MISPKMLHADAAAEVWPIANASSASKRVFTVFAARLCSDSARVNVHFGYKKRSGGAGRLRRAGNIHYIESSERVQFITACRCRDLKKTRNCDSVLGEK